MDDDFLFGIIITLVRQILLCACLDHNPIQRLVLRLLTGRRGCDQQCYMQGYYEDNKRAVMLHTM
jgi:hypothetical protein